MRVHRQLIALGTAGLMLVATTGVPHAAGYTAQEKLGRGAAAVTTAFLEVPGNMVAESRDRGAATGAPLGFAKGLGMIVVRELVGVYELLSAPFAVPTGYRPIIQPEYPWDYFENERAEPEIDRSRHGAR